MSDVQMEHILYEVRDRVGVITLNRPNQRNAQNKQLLVELDHAWDMAAEDPQVKVIVLKANGPHFSAGHDIARDETYAAKVKEALGDVSQDGLFTLHNWEGKYYLGFCRKWRDIPKPSIAVVQGACIAAGLMLAWPCDLIIAADNAKFSDPVALMGIGGVEYHGHTWEFGPRKAKEMLFTASAITAEEAAQLGMVNKVVPLANLEEEAMAMANKIARMHPFALSMAKRAVNQTMDIMGQYAALQAVFDIHQLGHGSALAMTGEAVLMGLDGLKPANKTG
ncbi:MAG TPA: enoyl-CoA hydratase [Alphaproteobacteria bacterium]|nr:enoyl-CoA hydratase [Alphaproteobacteria bacterium]